VVEESVFENCRSLKSISLSDSVGFIHDLAFLDYKYLHSKDRQKDDRKKVPRNPKEVRSCIEIFYT